MSQARAHRRDPSTSHEAAEQMNLSGMATEHRRIVLDLVRENPGLTGAELAYVSRGVLTQAQVQRRLRELVDDGHLADPESLFVTLGKKLCSQTRRTCVRWWAVDAVPNISTGASAPKDQANG